MASSKRRLAPRGDSARVVFEPLITTIIDLFIENLDTHVSTPRVHATRARMASALLKFDCLCKATRTLVKERAQLPFYRFYYASSLVMQSQPVRFLDRTFGVSLFEGSYGSGPADPAKFDVLNVRDALHDRTKIALRLACMDNTQLEKCKKYIPVDIFGVSPRVAAFVGRARMITQRLAARNPQTCLPCSRAGCGRMLLHDRSATCVGPPPVNTDAPIVEDAGSESSSESESDAEDTGNEYWSVLALRPRTKLLPRVFCSCACAQAYDEEVACAIPIELNDIEKTFSCPDGKVGLSRVAVEARSCFSRNAAVARAFRAAVRSCGHIKQTTISKSVVLKMHQDVTDALNVDLALVYAASILAESQTACAGRVLPATSAAWRDEAKAWRSAIRAIQQIYSRKWRPKDGIVTDQRLLPPWLQSIRNHVFTLFPLNTTF